MGEEGEGTRRSVAVSRGAAALSATVGASGLVGWATGIGVLKSISPTWVSMKANAAVGFVLAGASLWLATAPITRRTKTVSNALAGLVTLLGALTCVEFAGVDLGIDQLLFYEAPEAISTASPGRMAFISTVCFFLTGAGILLADRRGRLWMSQAMAAGVALISLTAVLGYSYGNEMHLGGSYNHMALHTALAFLALGTGVLALSSDHPPLAIAARRDAGGALIRGLAPALITIVLAFSMARVYGERAGLFGAEVGASVLTVASLLALCIAVWVAALSLGRAVAERDRAQAALAEQEKTRADELEREVDHRTSELASANRELESFSYSVSHDLRAPLRHIDGFATILEEDYAGRLDDEGREHLGRIRAAADRMAHLVDDLLKLSRVHRTEIVKGPVDVSNLAEKVIATLRARSPERSVVVVITPNLVAAADRGLLEIALENVLGNAWKFTSKRTEARIEVALANDEATLCVRDNGSGFDMAYAGKLFTPFQRMHSTAEFEGTGVGLATVQRVIQRHGGKAWAESKVGEGTTLFLTLPTLRVDVPP